MQDVLYELVIRTQELCNEQKELSNNSRCQAVTVLQDTNLVGLHQITVCQIGVHFNPGNKLCYTGILSLK